MIFKRKKKPTVESKPNPQKDSIVPTMKAACGFEYDGEIYKTAKDANFAYHKKRIADIFRQGDGFRDSYKAMSVGYVIASWEELKALAHEKLEIE